MKKLNELQKREMALWENGNGCFIESKKVVGI